MFQATNIPSPYLGYKIWLENKWRSTKPTSPVKIHWDRSVGRREVLIKGFFFKEWNSPNFPQIYDNFSK